MFIPPMVTAAITRPITTRSPLLLSLSTVRVAAPAAVCFDSVCCWFNRARASDCPVQAPAKVLGSEEEAIQKNYNVSCEWFFGFGSEMDEQTSNILEGCYSLMDQNQVPSLTKSTAFFQTKLPYRFSRSETVQHYLQNNILFRYSSCRNMHAERGSRSTLEQPRLGPVTSGSAVETMSLPNCDKSLPDSNSNSKFIASIQKILKSHEYSCELEAALNEYRLSVTEDLIVQVLQMLRSDWKNALSFFNWASRQNGYSHGSRSYNEILDILGRMKQIKTMRLVFDEIPKDRWNSVINERTFAILMHRYAGAHKVEEAIDIFYKRKDYGFELDIIAFQTLLMSLCRYKHVDEAEGLFFRKQNEFPPVMKSWNIILNGWCVLGNLREAKRFWNDILSSKCKPDLFTYSIFINSLTKSGKIVTALKMFTAMWETGCNPDVPIYNCIIDALCFKKRIPDALKIFGEMSERGCLPDVATYNSLIKHLCKIRRMEKVYELVDEMEQKGCLPNAITYSYILKTMEKPEEVSELLSKMKRKGCELNGDTYNLLLNSYVKWNYQTGIESIWSEMERSGSGPDQRSYTIMIHGLHRQGKVDDALQIYSKMMLKGMIPEPRTRLLVKAIHLKKAEIYCISNARYRFPEVAEKRRRVQKER